MTAEPENLVLVHLRELRREMREGFRRIEAQLDILTSVTRTMDAKLKSIELKFVDSRAAVQGVSGGSERHDDPIVDINKRLAALEAAVGITR